MTDDGSQLAGVYVRQPGAKYDVLYFGGNAARVDDYGRAVAREMSSLAANVVFFDYRGYGRSTGVPTINGLKRDALAIFDDWAARATGRPIVLHGFSLGSFMAAYVAEKRPVAGLILESSAPDVATWARNQIPFYAKPFVRLRIAPALLEESNAERLRSYAGPLLLITGQADPVTPPRFANELAAASRSNAITVVIVPGATHGNVLSFGPALRAYAEFLASLPEGRGRPAQSQ